MADLALMGPRALGNALALPIPLTRVAIEDHVEALIALLDHIDGDSDFEEDNEDCCAARDDTGGYHPNDGCGDGLPGDPLDIEEDDPGEDDDSDRCSAGEDMVEGGSALPYPYFNRDLGAGDPEDEEHDMLGRAAIEEARERIAAMRITREIFPGATWQEMFT